MTLSFLISFVLRAGTSEDEIEKLGAVGPILTSGVYPFKVDREFEIDRQGDDFTDILRAAFLYESFFLRSSFILTVWLCNFLAKECRHKSCL